MLLFFFKILPKNLISYIVGILSRIHYPTPIQLFILKTYAKRYKVNLEESEFDLADYKSLQQFFTRSLKKKARKIDQKKSAIVSPVDGILAKVEKIHTEKLFQAKHQSYSLSKLLEIRESIERFIGGYYYLFYLSPSHCHRIFTPCDAKVVDSTYFPGKLFPVNQWATKNINNLFSINERLVTYLSVYNKIIAMVKIGATNVGSIKVCYDHSIHTNRFFPRRFLLNKKYQKPHSFSKGEEIARFEMGSTVVLLFEKNFILPTNNIEGEIQYGQKIGEIIS